MQEVKRKDGILLLEEQTAALGADSVFQAGEVLRTCTHEWPRVSPERCRVEAWQTQEA